MTLSDSSFAFVDVETTGGNAVRDRIIDIAVMIMEKGEITKTWSTLIDPERRISGFITDITGITDSDVRRAPTFAAISQELLEVLDGKIFVAHNARFDYGFIKNEFRREDISWQAKTLCTVRLSRVLYPRFRSHSLDKIIERHGFVCENRHRAFDDTKVMIDFWNTALQEKGEETFTWSVQSLLKQPSLPSNLVRRGLDGVPNGTGVYIFYGLGDRPLYIGKSIELRSRVLSHFSGDHALSKDMEISKRVRRVEHRETVGELGALLMEATLIKKYQPLYNRKLRRSTGHCMMKIVEGKNKFETIAFVHGADIEPHEFDTLFGLFRTETSAIERLTELADAFGLCPKILGLETNKNNSACFSYHLKKCKGACCEEESADDHNIRLRIALSGMKHSLWPFKGRIGIRETDSITNKSEVHIVDQWCYMGSCASDEELEDVLTSSQELRFDVDHYKIIASFLRNKKAKKKSQWKTEIIRLPHPEVQKEREMAEMF